MFGRILTQNIRRLIRQKPVVRAVMLAGFLLGGCTATYTPLVPVPANPVVVRDFSSNRVAIVVSKNVPDYRQLSYVFAAKLGRPYQLFELEHRTEESVQRAVRQMDPTSVIALGHSALDVVSDIHDVDIVYAGVFEESLDHRGVDALPPFTMQLEHWRMMSPHLSQIGVVGSSAIRDRVEALKKAGLELGIVVHHREVKSDKEALLAFRGMVPYLDGFVFLPDETVLSPKVIRRVLAHGARNGLQIMVYSPVMFSMGAFLYVASEPVDVATQIMSLLNSKDSRQPLTRMRTRVNLGQAIADDAGD